MAQTQMTPEDAVHERHPKPSPPDDVALAQLVPALARKLGLPEGEYTLTVEGTAAPLATGTSVADFNRASELESVSGHARCTPPLIRNGWARRHVPLFQKWV